MAKEKKEKEQKEKTGALNKQLAQQHGEVNCLCNKCGEPVKVPVGRMYSKVELARLAQPKVEVPALMDAEGTVLKDAYTIPARPYKPRRQLMHCDFGGSCTGTLRTTPNPNKRRGIGSKKR